MTNTIKTQASCADNFDPAAITVDAAREKIIEEIQPVSGILKRSLRQCLNYALAETIHSPINVPSHTNSAMDGYALHGNDLPQDEIKSYEIIGTAYAGQRFEGSCQSGQVVRIMTGAVMPEGCDTVVMQEQTETIDELQVKIGAGHRPGQNVRQAGEDIAEGAEVLPVGRHISPADLGIMASLGISETRVFRRPRVAFFSTGDELRSVGETLQPGDIYDSNRYTLYGMLKRCNIEILDMGVVPDDPDRMRETFLEASSMADVIITSGGVSVGDADYIKTILAELGEIQFWKIGMKPGRPLTFGSIGNARFFGLPGNPVSVMITFYQFVQPALHYLGSGQTRDPVTLKANCQSHLRKRSGRVEFQRGIYQQSSNGELEVRKTGKQGSGILSSMSHANCFIVLPVDSSSIEPGETVLIQPFDSFV